MSQTISIGVVGPSHWAYMAAVMAECLEQVARKRSVDPEDIPRGVYDDAAEFFQLLLPAATGRLPDNPPASINAYLIAADALKGSSEAFPATLEELDTRMGQYWEFLEHLQTPHNLTPEEVRLAEALQRLFRQLSLAGEAEMYTRTVSCFDPDPASRGYRLS